VLDHTVQHVFHRIRMEGDVSEPLMVDLVRQISEAVRLVLKNSVFRNQVGVHVLDLTAHEIRLRFSGHVQEYTTPACEFPFEGRSDADHAVCGIKLERKGQPTGRNGSGEPLFKYDHLVSDDFGNDELNVSFAIRKMKFFSFRSDIYPGWLLGKPQTYGAIVQRDDILDNFNLL